MLVVKVMDGDDIHGIHRVVGPYLRLGVSDLLGVERARHLHVPAELVERLAHHEEVLVRDRAIDRPWWCQKWL